MPGDRVGYVWSADAATPVAGVVRYVGPVKGLGEDGHWFGVELLEVKPDNYSAMYTVEREVRQVSDILLST